MDILEAHYDSQQPWGIEFGGGDIVEAPRIVDANDPYLLKNITPNIRKKSVVTFSKITFDRGKYFTIEALVLHNKDKHPEVKILGKIAGIDNPHITPLPKKEISFFGEVFFGSWSVQLVRCVIFFIGSLITLFLMIIITEEIQTARLKRRKKHFKSLLGPFLEHLDRDSQELVNRIALKTSCKLDALKSIMKKLTDEESVRNALENAKQLYDRIGGTIWEESNPSLSIESIPIPVDFITKRGDGEVIINTNSVDLLRRMIEFLDSREKEDKAKIPITR